MKWQISRPDSLARRILVRVCGDHWLNADQVRAELVSADPQEHLVLDISTEGPSLERLGVLQMLRQFCIKTGRSPDTLHIDNWHNMVEPCEFDRLHRPLLSHFFWLSDRWRPSSLISATGHRWFACFVGRLTLPRQRMLWDLYHDHAQHCLLSLMRGPRLHSPSLDRTQDWLQDIDMPTWHAWWANPPLDSLDGHELNDQYRPGHNTNQDILEFYDQFAIEIVAETYTLGEAFFPTEKTLRPLLTGKPCLIYAAPNYLARLQDLGFRTWSRVWDESYDQLEGPQRWCAIKKIIDSLITQPLQALRDSLQSIACHNRNQVIKLADTHRPS